jgi:dUTP pyrophosphatase
MKVKIKRLHKDAVIPSYAKHGDAGLDLVATSIISFDKEQVTYGTGIAIEIPEGFVGLIFPRSSIRKYEQYLSNSVGVIDSGYRGEIQATFNSRYYADVKYKVGDKIAQLLILPYPSVEFEETHELSSTERGEGGFGSSGN